MSRAQKIRKRVLKRKEAEFLEELYSQYLISVKSDILDLWKRKWKKAARNNTCEQMMIQMKFMELFFYVYRSVHSKSELNKLKNFKYKSTYLFICIIEAIGLPLGILFILFLLLGKNQNIAIESIVKVLLGSGILFTGVTVFSKIAAKWIAVAKYQETWARHSRQRQKMEREILLYLTDMNPYDDNDRNNVFIYRMLQIWDRNQEKFADNLENREEGLLFGKKGGEAEKY